MGVIRNMNFNTDTKHEEEAGKLLDTISNEIMNLPPRNDWHIKAKLLRTNIVISLISLLLMLLGLGIVRMKPSLFGGIFMIVGFIGFFSYLGNILSLFLRPFNAKILLEYFVPNGLDYRFDKEHIAIMKNKAPLYLLLPRDRSRYTEFYDLTRRILEREVQRRGGGFIDCKGWYVIKSKKERYVTCIVELARITSNQKEAIGILTLEAVKSIAGNWYLVLPMLDKIDSSIEFREL
jgi:hypothetical protein